MLKRLSKILSVIMIMTMVLVPSQVSAIDKIDQSQPVSLTLTVSESAMTGMELDLYKVADISEWAEFTLTGDFAEYNVTVNGLDSEGWKSLAETLSGYADRDSIKPVMSVEVSDSGTAAFGTLEQGLYLIDGDEVYSEEKVYTPTPFMIALPNRAADSEVWDYNVKAVLKYGISDEVPESGTAGQQGDGDPAIEDDERDNPGEEDENGVDDEDGNLPQTGVLWWPVPVMIAAGLLLVIIGVVKRRGAESES